MEEFVSYYRNHMMMEEEHFFPAAAKALLEDDWAEIEFDLFEREDPLFDRSAHERFHRLREKIDKSAGEFSRQTLRFRQAKRVQQLRRTHRRHTRKVRGLIFIGFFRAHRGTWEL